MSSIAGDAAIWGMTNICCLLQTRLISHARHIDYEWNVRRTRHLKKAAAGLKTQTCSNAQVARQHSCCHSIVGTQTLECCFSCQHQFQGASLWSQELWKTRCAYNMVVSQWLKQWCAIQHLQFRRPQEMFHVKVHINLFKRLATGNRSSMTPLSSLGEPVHKHRCRQS